jgi:hypothetical protein
VRDGHGPHDREAKAPSLLAGRSVGLQSSERLKQPIDAQRRDRGASVGDAQDGFPRTHLGRDLKVTVRDVIARRVLDEVRREPFEQVRLALHNRVLQTGLDVQAAKLNILSPQPERASGDLGEIHRHPTLQPSFASCQREERLEQSLLLLFGDEDALECCPPRIQRRLRIAQSVLDQGTLTRERRPELV